MAEGAVRRRGRPRRDAASVGGPAKAGVLVVRVEAGLHRRLRLLSAMRGVTLSELAAAALDSYVSGEWAKVRDEVARMFGTPGGE